MKKKTYFILISLNLIINFAYKIIYRLSAAGDSDLYISLAKQYLAGNFFNPNTNCTGHSFYSFFLIVFGSPFAYNHYVISFFQILIFSISSLLLVSELEKYTQRNLLGIVVLLFLVPEIHQYNALILTESVGYSLLLLSFYMALKIYNDGMTIQKILLLSVLLAFTVLNRSESIVIFIPVLFIIYPKGKEKLLITITLLLLAPSLLLMLNGWKNYKIYGVYKLTSFQGGEVIYGGNSDNLDGSHHKFWEYKNIFFKKEQLKDVDKILAQPECISCPQRDSFLFQLSTQAWKNNPVSQIKVIPRKLAKNWLLPGNFDIYTSDTTKKQGLQIDKLLSKKYWNNAWYAPYKHLFYMLIYWLYLLMIIIGIFKRDKEDRFQTAILILLVFYLGYTIPFSGLPRWHVCIFPLLVIAFTPFAAVQRINDLIYKIAPQKFRL